MNIEKKEKSRKLWELFVALVGATASAFLSWLFSKTSNSGGVKTSDGDTVSHIFHFDANTASTIFTLMTTLVICYIVYILIRISAWFHFHDFWDSFS